MVKKTVIIEDKTPVAVREPPKKENLTFVDITSCFSKKVVCDTMKEYMLGKTLLKFKIKDKMDLKTYICWRLMQKIKKAYGNKYYE